MSLIILVAFGPMEVVIRPFKECIKHIRRFLSDFYYEWCVLFHFGRDGKISYCKFHGV